MNQFSALATHEHPYDASVKMESMTDRAGIIVEVNDAFVEVSGYARDELIGRNHNIVRHPDMPQVAFMDLWQSLREEGQWRGILKNRCKNGDYYWVDETIEPVYEAGELVGYHSIQTRPSQRQIEMAEGLYRHLGSGH